ncbi:Holliday junction resolvase RuvX [Candidatus Uhrbacteria bacterium]|jgi:putative holliday junction resolvase|nr:Holliday junction resolvase RuvX [Candidatus Uhrbacteria bacterium]MBT7716794.1 Holliday junction resolvase RuvX [Candidatus Uhrbacteria bacterium]
MRYLGIDFGLKKIGLALGDSETKISSPIETVVNTEMIFDELAELVKKEGVDQIVIGAPLEVGKFHDGEQLRITQEFSAELRSKLGIEVHEVDESFTTAESKRLQKEEGSRAPEDSLAAMLILQSFLDLM